MLDKIGQLATFIICAQTIMHFRAKGSYEKYIKLLVSIMLLIMLVEPILSLFGGEKENGFLLERIKVYQSELEGIMGRETLDNGEIEAILTNITYQVSKEIKENEKVESSAYVEANNEVTERKIEETREGIRVKSIKSVSVEVPYGEDSGFP